MILSMSKVYRIRSPCFSRFTDNFGQLKHLFHDEPIMATTLGYMFLWNSTPNYDYPFIQAPQPTPF